MKNWSSHPRLLLALLLLTASATALSQTLPIRVATSGNTATIEVGPTGKPLSEVIITFDDASGLSAASLGVSAQLVDLSDPLLLARLPAQTSLDSALPLLITIEPPSLGGLAFNRTARVELHTHALIYTAGSPYRLLKAPLNGAFRDITDEISPGSVRARGTTGGFSQFLIVADARSSKKVIAEKISSLRATVASLPQAERAPFDLLVNEAEAAVASGRYADAIVAVDSIRERAAARAGVGLAQQWRAAGGTTNHAGLLMAGAATLKFGIAFLRDYGE